MFDREGSAEHHRRFTPSGLTFINPLGKILWPSSNFCFRQSLNVTPFPSLEFKLVTARRQEATFLKRCSGLAPVRRDRSSHRSLDL